MPVRLGRDLVDLRPSIWLVNGEVKGLACMEKIELRRRRKERENSGGGTTAESF